MNNVCILIDGDYPYFTEETFLETEIRFLSGSFQTVIIFSYNGLPDSVCTRTVPDNVTVVPLATDRTSKRYVKYPLYAITHKDSLPKNHVRGLKAGLLEKYQRGRSLYAFNRIVRWLDEHHIDCRDAVIYSYWLTDHALTAVRLRQYLIQKGLSVKAVSRGHGFDVYSERNSLGAWPYQKYAVGNLDAVYICSENGAAYLKSKYPEAADKINVAYLGTDDYMDKSAIAPNRTLLVTCSSLKKVKRVSLFAEAFCMLIDRGIDCFWVCIGDGEENDLIRSIINEHNCGDRVTFAGRLTNTQVIDYYKQHDISYFCNVSESEGLPVSIMEVMSFGVPCIATAAGGTGELVNEQTGRLMPVDIDAGLLCDELATELQQPQEQYLNKRKNARKTWEHKVSAPINYSKWCRMLCDGQDSVSQ